MGLFGRQKRDAAIDYPTHVAELLGDPAIDRLGGWAAIRDQGLTNLRALEGLGVRSGSSTRRPASIA